jgi:hypothetical protein
MVIKSYFEGSNTIVFDNNTNFGFNPITNLFYGVDGYSRYIFKFNLDYIKKFVCDGTFADTCKLKHTLHMYNAGGMDFRQMEKLCSITPIGKQMQRAISFDLILFQVPVDWDSGRGHDAGKFIIGDGYVSNQGSNWFNSHTCIQWGYNRLGEYTHMSNKPYGGVVNGIYNNNFLQQEYRKYLNKEKSIILTTQHFNLGSENIEIDLTDIINNMLLNPDAFPNNGFCLAFEPFLEIKKAKPSQTVNFFTNNTSTWFEPHLTTEYNLCINDNRADFYLDKWNKLYLYSNIGGQPTNLNKKPICTIKGNYENGGEYKSTPEVKQATKGIYYVDVLLPSYVSEDKEIESNRMFYDEWSNIEHFDCDNQSGVKLKPVELDFTTKSADNFYLIGNNDFLPKQYSPTLSGIKYNERIERENGEIRKIIVQCTIPYTENQSEIIDELEYKVYIRDGNKVIDWCDWQPVHKGFNHNFFYLDIDSFLPNEYYIRVKTSSNLEVKVHDSLKFQIISKEKNGHYS